MAEMEVLKRFHLTNRQSTCIVLFVILREQRNFNFEIVYKFMLCWSEKPSSNCEN